MTIHRSWAGFGLGLVATITAVVGLASMAHRPVLAAAALTGAVAMVWLLRRRVSAVGVVLGVLAVPLLCAAAVVGFVVWVEANGGLHIG